MSGGAQQGSPEKENHALELRAEKAEAAVLVANAQAEAKVARAEAKVAVAAAEAKVAEAKAETKVVAAEAKASIAELKLEHEISSAAHKLELAHRDFAAEHMELLTQNKMRNLRGAVEFISGLIFTRLQARQVPAPRGVQNLLDAALAHDANLQAVVRVLAVRHKLREHDVRQCFANLYHLLSKGMHGVGDAIVVRAADFPASTERLALCALLETYDITYAYVGGNDTEMSPSPYALTAAERLSANPPATVINA